MNKQKVLDGVKQKMAYRMRADSKPLLNPIQRALLCDSKKVEQSNFKHNLYQNQFFEPNREQEISLTVSLERGRFLSEKNSKLEKCQTSMGNKIDSRIKGNNAAKRYNSQEPFLEDQSFESLFNKNEEESYIELPS